MHCLTPIKTPVTHPEFGMSVKDVELNGRRYRVSRSGEVRGYVRNPRVLTIHHEDLRSLPLTGPTAIRARAASGWFE
ncbi:hypothetical protein D869_gp155 [Caulobacter phage CcrRogue]|uniref:Uncharacterized protein n=1 Tax=Caulobacter phage CcrRogue TaxID=2927986 RepID=K4JNF2_9CAUD|nr:hypothetical protein D869_gp155 [Caulobacter phage CcrRogue]AFU86759.1 hypothetical protein CcrRogue_gp277 [Caulobacter phage CcrRogue]